MIVNEWRPQNHEKFDSRFTDGSRLFDRSRFTRKGTIISRFTPKKNSRQKNPGNSRLLNENPLYQALKIYLLIYGHLYAEKQNPVGSWICYATVVIEWIFLVNSKFAVYP